MTATGSRGSPAAAAAAAAAADAALTCSQAARCRCLLHYPHAFHQPTRNMKASTATRPPRLVTMNESKSMRVRAERQLDSMMPGRTSSLRGWLGGTGDSLGGKGIV